ncbi:hypothetical protein M569_16661, partial [Genlisea aurea]
LGHSDPEKLKEAASVIHHLSPDDLDKRRTEVEKLMERLKVASDAELMQIAIDDLNNSSLSHEDRHRALQELLILVEPIDNANDLHKLGGLAAIISQLNDPDPEVRAVAGWILGKASQNNHFVQSQILELGALMTLMDMARSDHLEEATKALYAISALIRNNIRGQELFYEQNGTVMLEFISSNSSIDVRLLRKSVFLLADLVESQLEGMDDDLEQPFFNDPVLLKSLVDLLASEDLDLQEKALYAVKNLLLLRYTDALIFKEICKLDVALGRMQQRLRELDRFEEFANDMESLRREVEVLFAAKL